MPAYDPKRTPGGRRSISACGGKGPRAVYLAGGLIGSGGRGVTSATLTVVPGRSMSVTTTRTPFNVTSKNAVMLDRGDAIDLDIERPWMRGDIHEHACGRILRKEFRIDAVDGGEHLHRCAIDGALQNVVEGGASGLHAEF